MREDQLFKLIKWFHGVRCNLTTDSTYDKLHSIHPMTQLDSSEPHACCLPTSDQAGQLAVLYVGGWYGVFMINDV